MTVPQPAWLGAPKVRQVPRVVRAAFAARVSTDDQQDPTLPLPRQLAACQRAPPEDMVVVLHFYDIESGRTDLALRGRGTAHQQFDLPIPEPPVREPPGDSPGSRGAPGASSTQSAMTSTLRIPDC